jgi:Na+/H+ antiporter NhaB
MLHLLKILFVVIGVTCTCYTVYSFVFAGKEENQADLLIDKKIREFYSDYKPSNVPDVDSNPYIKKGKL